MDINDLIKNITDNYKDSIQSKKEEYINRQLNIAIKESVKNIQDIKEKHKILELPEEVTNNVVQSAELEYQSMLNKQKSLTMTDTNNVIKNVTENYINSVKGFSNNGGRDFYDVGSIISFRSNFDAENFVKEINQLKEQGIDIKILKEKHFEHENIDRYTVSAKFSIVMPSSHYPDYENMLIKKLPEDDGLTMSRKNFFIPPFVRKRDNIPNIEIQNLERNDKLDRYNFSHLGYSTIEIDTLCGYGKFNEIRPDKNNLNEAIEQAFDNTEAYEHKSDYIAGMMPTLLCYSSEDVNELNIDENDNHKRTIVKDINLLEIDQFKLQNDLSSSIKSKNGTYSRKKRKI